MNKGLIIKKEWLNKIFNNGKVWEMRSTHTKISGNIKLIESGSGHIVGECILDRSVEIPIDQISETFRYHQVEDLELLKKWRFAWFLREAKKYDKPIPYNHPQGAVIWVNLPAEYCHD